MQSQSVGRPDAIVAGELGRLKAIQNPQGKSRGRCVVAIDLPTQHCLPVLKAGFSYMPALMALMTACVLSLTPIFPMMELT